jgi:hypothetical protein
MKRYLTSPITGKCGPKSLILVKMTIRKIITRTDKGVTLKPL